MKRRAFLQALALVPGLVIKAPQEKHSPWPNLPPFTKVYTTDDTITYTDSEGHAPAELAALGDDNRTTGVTYQP